MVVVKVQFGGDLKRVVLDETKNLSWNILKEQIIQRFQLDPLSQLSVKYKDSEGDLISISCDAELRDSLISAVKGTTDTVLRLELTVSNNIFIDRFTESYKIIEEEQRKIEEQKRQEEEAQRRKVEAEAKAKAEAEAEKKRLEEEEERKQTQLRIKAEEEEKRRIEEEEEAIKRKNEDLQREKEKEEQRKREEEESQRKKVEEEQRKIAEEKKKLEEKAEEERKKLEEQHQQAQVENNNDHIGVTCDGCQKQIFGVRFKCGNCPDFDYCEICEGTLLHNPTHVFIKIRVPISSNVSNQYRYRPMLPLLYPPNVDSFHRVFSLLPFKSFVNTTPTQQPQQPQQPIQQEQPAQQQPAQQQPAQQQPAQQQPAQQQPVQPETQQPTQLTFEAQYICDMNYPDGSIVRGGAKISKQWKMKNTGSHAWPVGTKLTLVGAGKDLSEGAKALSFDVPSTLPNQEVTIEIPITVTKKLGRFLTLWRLQTPDGEKFGHRIWCDLVVTEEDVEEEEKEETVITPQTQTQTQTQTPQTHTIVQLETPFIPQEEPSINMVPFSGSLEELTSTQEIYEKEMKELLTMGFLDRTKNLKLLTKYQGNLEETINELCL